MGDVQLQKVDIEEQNAGTAKPGSGQADSVPEGRNEPAGLSKVRLALLPVVTAGVGFGWALQLSLLTPYIQTLGVEREFSSMVWLCGPIAGLVVQPIVGRWTDRCTSNWGRRRPFITSGVLLIILGVLLISFGADIGSLLGDSKESCETFKGKRSHAVSVVILGFWLLDIAANTVDPPLRALLADLSGPHQLVTANVLYTFWGALGSVLGYAAGSYSHWHEHLPSLLTNSCCAPCANLKAAFLLQIILLAISATISIVVAKESSVSIPPKPLTAILQDVRKLSKSITYVLVVMAISWFSWFPWFLYDTDWMGREVYGGDPQENSTAYQRGVTRGALGLLLNSVVSGVSSLIINPLCRTLGSKNVWALADFLLCLAFVFTEVIRRIGAHGRRKVGALVLFAALGFPWAITLTVPYSMTAELTAASGLTLNPRSFYYQFRSIEGLITVFYLRVWGRWRANWACDGNFECGDCDSANNRDAHGWAVG